MQKNQHFLFCIGDTLYYFRKKENITQEKLAELTNLHRTYISDIERGQKNVTVKNLFMICSALNISLSEFFSKVENIL